MNPQDETELRIQIQELYRTGGIQEVLECVKTMNRCQIVILSELQYCMSKEIKYD